MRHAEALHSRSNLSLGRRSALLNDLKGRYELDQGAAGIAPPAVGGAAVNATLRRSVAARQFDFGSAAALVGLPATTGNPISKGAGEPSASSAAQFRVKRPGRDRANSDPVTHLQRKAGETLPPTSIGADVSASPSVRETAALLVGQRANTIAPSLPLAQVGELPRLAVLTRLHLRREPDGPSAEREAIEGDDMPRKSTLEQLLGDRMAALSGGSFDGLPLPRNVAPTSRRQDLPGGVATTLSSRSSSGRHMRPEADHQSAPLPVGSPQTGDTAVAIALVRGDTQSLLPVSPEIRAAILSPGSTGIVWRKADANGAGGEAATQGSAAATGGAHALGTGIMRQSASQTYSGSDVAPVAAQTTPTTGGIGVDIVRVAEQVNRIIARQLRVERERRGRTR